ncbi:zinc-binding dehydrogenase [Streptomyces physcomitrii]|uniref:zinc-binding dehydrogenase n=1 Tax=Streptomyces physcomitrii TaxID=2724184 RepID=UPI00340CC117
MRALEPTGLDEAMVAFAEVPEPEPQADEVVVEVDAFSVNRGETFLLAGPRPGWRPGKDVAGRVVRAAADGSGPAEGSRVVAHPPAAGWAERVAVAARSTAVLPESVDAATAAVLPLAGITAVRLLRQSGAAAGDRVLITGASGGVGHYVTELAAAAGIEITAVTATPERGERLAALGAAQVVQSVAEAKGPFQVVLESVGHEVLPATLPLLTSGGRLIWFGQASRQPSALNFFHFFRKPDQDPFAVTLEHFDYTRGERSYGEELAELVDLVATGRLHPEIGLRGDWTGTAEAIAALRARTVRGNVVLTTGEGA